MRLPQHTTRLADGCDSFLYLRPEEVEISLYFSSPSPFETCYRWIADPDFVALVRGLDTGEGPVISATCRSVVLTPFGCGVLADWLEDHREWLNTAFPSLTDPLLTLWATALRKRLQ